MGAEGEGGVKWVEHLRAGHPGSPDVSSICHFLGLLEESTWDAGLPLSSKLWWFWRTSLFLQQVLLSTSDVSGAAL